MGDKVGNAVGLGIGLVGLAVGAVNTLSVETRTEARSVCGKVGAGVIIGVGVSVGDGDGASVGLAVGVGTGGGNEARAYVWWRPIREHC